MRLILLTAVAMLAFAGNSLLNRIEDQLTNKMRAILATMDPAMREILIISLGAFLQAAQGQTTAGDKRPEADLTKERKNRLTDNG